MIDEKYFTKNGRLKPSTPQNIKDLYYRAKVIKESKGKLTLVSSFTKARNKHTFKCNKGHLFDSVLYSITSNKQGCPKCSGTYRRTQEEAELDIRAKGLYLLSAFTKVSDKHEFKCEKGHIWEAKYSSVLGLVDGCPKCAGHFRRTHIEAQGELREGIFLISPFTKARDIHEFKCSEGHIWRASYYSVKANTGCPICAGKNPNIIYFWALGNTGIYKYGITSKDRKYNRINEIASLYNVVPEILVYREVKECKEIENIIKENYKEFKADIIGKGCTEMLDLTNEQAIELKTLLEVI